MKEEGWQITINFCFYRLFLFSQAFASFFSPFCSFQLLSAFWAGPPGKLAETYYKVVLKHDWVDQNSGDREITDKKIKNKIKMSFENVPFFSSRSTQERGLSKKPKKKRIGKQKLY
jgi:hypothetical protein